MIRDHEEECHNEYHSNDNNIDNADDENAKDGHTANDNVAQGYRASKVTSRPSTPRAGG